MNTLSYKTVSANKATVTKQWVLVDAENQTVGRLASVIALVLRGKHRPDYTPHVDCGDNVVVINAGKVRFSGAKWEQKKYIHHTGFPGGQREVKASMLFAKRPGAVLEHAIKGMLPKNRLGRRLFSNLYVYAGTEHEQEAQNPQTIDLSKIK
ncbi:MAG: 50S ribosomal protein L13 [Salinivirgaceae bacterium]|nr:50S ribosomal protein L13 [Salinivirgaceae bacterium]